MMRTQVWLLAVALTAGLIVVRPGIATAQVLIPGAVPSGVPPMAPPPAPPPPKIEVPVVPQFDAPPSTPRAQLPRRGHFSDRVARCLDEGAAMGLNAADRATYSRACANQ